MAQVPAQQGLRRPPGRLSFGAVIAVCGALVLAGCGGGNEAERDESGDVVASGAVAAADLQVGDCVLLPEGDEYTVEELEAVPCDTAHDGEVYVRDVWAEGDYPGEEVFDEQVLERCDQQFEAFVGGPYDDTELDIQYFYPADEGSWEADRSVLCMVYHPDERVTGTLEGAFEQHRLLLEPAASSLALGDCVGAPATIEWAKVPCDTPHFEEIYSLGVLPAGAYPGEEAAMSAVDALCEAAYEPYVGVSWDESFLSFLPLPPTPEAWGAGDRAYACAIVSEPLAPRTGSVKGRAL